LPHCDTTLLVSALRMGTVKGDLPTTSPIVTTAKDCATNIARDATMRRLVAAPGRRLSRSYLAANETYFDPRILGVGVDNSGGNDQIIQPYQYDHAAQRYA
jgi:hypothetical protein